MFSKIDCVGSGSVSAISDASASTSTRVSIVPRSAGDFAVSTRRSRSVQYTGGRPNGFPSRTLMGFNGPSRGRCRLSADACAATISWALNPRSLSGRASSRGSRHVPNRDVAASHPDTPCVLGDRARFASSQGLPRRASHVLLHQAHSICCTSLARDSFLVPAPST